MSDNSEKNQNTDEQPTTSPGGSPIYRHQERERPFQLARSNEDVEQIEAHITRYLGGLDWVFHELVSDLIHIDVHVIEPTHSRYYYTLVTTGMSDLPMHPPEAAADCRYAELMLCLPPTWKLSQDAFNDEANYWVVRWLKMLARLPHQYETWLWTGHTIPNNDPPSPFSGQTQLSGVILWRPKLFKEEFLQLKINDEKTVNFFSMIPLYSSEMDFKLNNGTNALFDLLAENNVTELLIQRRDPVC